MFSDEAVTPFLVRLRADLPGLEVLDAHTHIGFNDPDGMRCAPETLLEALEVAGNRGVVFPMHEPERLPAANDWVREEAARSEGRLVPFARLDPREDPVAEGERSLDAGARGLKLHPRAEEFAMDEPGVEPIVALAQERSVPLIVHAGRGIPALGRHVVELCRSHPGANVILAHAGICDLAWIWREARELPNLFFDTSWWSASDLMALMSLVPPGQVLLASDAPYGSPSMGAVLALRCALQAGLGEEAVRSMAGGQVERLLDGEEPLDLGPARRAGARPRPAPRPGADLPHLRDRPGPAGRPSHRGHRPGAPGLRGGRRRARRRRCARRCSPCWRTRRTCRADPDRPTRFMPVLPRLILAGLLVRTPDVPLPGVETPVDVAARPKGTG